jgi:hypothetical protein
MTTILFCDGIQVPTCRQKIIFPNSQQIIIYSKNNKARSYNTCQSSRKESYQSLCNEYGRSIKSIKNFKILGDNQGILNTSSIT